MTSGNRLIIITFIVAILLIAFGVVIAAKAQEIVPAGVKVWERQDGALCVTDQRNDGPHTTCQCPCETQCEVNVISTDEKEDPKPFNPTEKPSTPEQEPTATLETTEKPDPTKTLQPTEEPIPTDKPKPTKTEKVKCNAGRGNGSEGDPDCDPGNSGGHNQGGD